MSSKTLQVRLAEIFKWIGVGAIDKANLTKVQENAAKAWSTTQNESDERFLNSLAALCRIELGRAPVTTAASHFDTVTGYLKSVSPDYIDRFRLNG